MFKYDIEYYYGMLKNYTPTAKYISEIRWKFIECAKAKTILDFGCGVGWFKAYAPDGVTVDTYDIMPLPITGRRHERYDLVSFWDVLEHIADFNEIKDIFAVTNYVAITVPIKPKYMRWKNYKHYKPLEHIHHFTEDSLKDLMDHFGFKLVKFGLPECPPRKYIASFLFVRKENEKTNTDKSVVTGRYTNINGCHTGSAY
jgi:hypothetical protein